MPIAIYLCVPSEHRGMCRPLQIAAGGGESDLFAARHVKETKLVPMNTATILFLTVPLSPIP